MNASAHTARIIYALALLGCVAPWVIRRQCSLNQTFLNEIMGKQKEFGSFSLEPALGLAVPEGEAESSVDTAAQLAMSELKNATLDEHDLKACLNEYLKLRPRPPQPPANIPGPVPPSALQYQKPFHLGGLTDDPAPEFESSYFPNPYDTYVNPYNFMKNVPSYEPSYASRFSNWGKVGSFLSSAYNSTVHSIYEMFEFPDLSDLFEK